MGGEQTLATPVLNDHETQPTAGNRGELAVQSWYLADRVDGGFFWF